MRDENINLQKIKNSINAEANLIAAAEFGIFSLNFLKITLASCEELPIIVRSMLDYFTSDNEFASWLLDINVGSNAGPLPQPMSKETERATRDLFTLAADARLSLYLRWVLNTLHTKNICPYINTRTIN